MLSPDTYPAAYLFYKYDLERLCPAHTEQRGLLDPGTFAQLSKVDLLPSTEKEGWKEKKDGVSSTKKSLFHLFLNQLSVTRKICMHTGKRRHSELESCTNMCPALVSNVCTV